jgi:hypothetical protein
MLEFNKGERLVVTEDFEYDGTSFVTGMTGTVIKFHSDRGVWGVVSIEWDHEDKQNFHTCGGLCPSSRGYNLDVYEAKLGPITADVKANPLPDDPRLRGIAIKIKQMETRFKIRQLAKLKQKEQADEISQSISVQDGLSISQITSAISRMSTSSF